jgi:sensor domain CHASE-containing protein
MENLPAVLVIIGCLLVVVLAAVWVAFPFIVNNRFSHLIQVQTHQLSATENLERLLESAVKEIKARNAVHAETNRAMQWMVDNWPGQAQAEPERD